VIATEPIGRDTMNAMCHRQRATPAASDTGFANGPSIRVIGGPFHCRTDEAR
jgi:hypothetical protein